MTTYEPGTVAVATVRGVEGVRVMAGYGTAEPRLRWLTTDARLMDVHNDGWYFAYDVTDVRPLVVLDVPYPRVAVSVLRQIAEYIREKHGVEVEDSTIADDFADQIEAQTKPPRIPEPGPWGVVRARLVSTPGATVWTAVRLDDGDWRVDDGGTFAWDDLIDPTLVREGLS